MNEREILVELLNTINKVIETNTIKYGRYELIEAVRKAEKLIQTKPE